MTPKISRLSTERDTEALLKFWNENHEESFDDRYRWAHTENPAGKGITFLMRDGESDECIGCSAVIPRRMRADGVSLRGGVARDFFVHKRHRILGPALKLVKEPVSVVRENELDLVYAFPNKKAEPVMKRAGFKYLGPYIRMVKPVRISGRRQNLSWFGHLTRPMMALLDAGLWLSAVETRYRSRGGFVCKEVSTFDERFEALWEESKLRSKVTGERDRDFLDWKYRRGPGVEYKIFAISNSDESAALGYIVYCVEDGAVDIRDVVLPESKKAIRVLVTHFLRYVRRLSPTSVTVHFLENAGIMRLFSKYGFVRRSCDRQVYYCCNEHVIQAHPGLKDPENWFLLNGEVHY